MSQRSSIFAVAIAFLLAVVVPFDRLALARVSATVTCCCGVHDANEKCGCGNCPSLVDEPPARGGHEREPSVPQLRSCRTDFHMGAPPLDVPFTLPDGPEIQAGRPLPAPPMTDSGPEDRALDPPLRPS